MKKVYLLFMMVSFTVALFAQSARPTMTLQQAKNQTVTKKFDPTMSTPKLTNSAVPTRGTSGLVVSPDYIGSTYQEQQTNYNQHNKISVFPDGTASAVWMTAPYNGAATLRGTGYNYFDGTQWVNAYDDIQRIEDVRTGWPCTAPVGTNGEIVVSHNGVDALVINVRAQKGTGNWTQTTLQGPVATNFAGNTSTALLWPDIATNGNTIHLIAVTESDTGYLYNGINRCLLYYRGTYDETSNTITWENPRKVFNATPEMYTYFGADCYTIAANGNNVAILYLTTWNDARIWKSTDNGDNFNTIMLFDNPMEDDNANPQSVDTNLINYLPKGISTIAVGADGKVHAAFDLMRMHWTDTAVHYSWWPNWNYQLVYWNEDMPVFSGRTALDADTLLANGYPLFDLEDLDGDDTIRVYKDINEYANEIQGSIISYPQLTVDGNNVYMVYCAMYEDPFKGTNNQYCPQLHGIFGTRSTDGGHSWNNGVSWISYGKDIFYVEDWTTGSPTIFIDNDNIFPAVSKQVMNGKLVVDWMMDVMPDITTNRLANVIAKIIPTDSLGVYNNVEEIKQGLWIDPTGIADNTLEGMKLYPNPATDNLSVAISSNEHASADLSIVNLMGQVVYSENVALNEGNNLLNVSVSNLTPGVYMINIRTNKGTSTQKLIVK
ncbi:MAG: T9SS type A sorting domain-containing protein [Bacteroidales bacterium]|nr:T9SS type A sorting domain-containing protein [Bacteroidales bacterium]